MPKSPNNPFEILHFKDHVGGGRQLERWRPSRMGVIERAEFAAPSPAPPKDEDEDFRLWSAIAPEAVGTRLERMSYPGGFDRDAARLHLEDGRSYIAIIRPQLATCLETYALRRLHAAGADVPEVVWYRGRLLITADMGRDRLSEPIAKGEDAWDWIARGADSLARLHDIGSAIGLDTELPPIGTRRRWLKRFIDQPRLIGEALGMPTPDYDRDGLLRRLTDFPPRFVRWDARPGNAMRLANGAIGWFDFEAAGQRARLDDLAWLIGDELIPEDEAREADLLDRLLPEFADGLGDARARQYLAAFGTLHQCVRVGFMLREKRSDGWSDHRRQLARDQSMVDMNLYFRLCIRAARWSLDAPELAPLAPWLARIAISAPEDR